MTERRLNKILFAVPLLVRPEDFAFEPWMEEKAARYLPVGSLSLAGYLLKQDPGFTIQLIDLNAELPLALRGRADKAADLRALSEAVFRERLLKFRPDVVAISCLFHSASAQAHDLARLAKDALGPEVTVIMGGTYPSTSWEVAAADPAVDYLVLGEGERRLYRLLEYLEGRLERGDLEGVVLKEDGVPVRLEPASTMDLGELGVYPLEISRFTEYTGWSDTRDGSYITSRDKTMALAITRGCPNICTYCNSGQANWRGKYRIPDLDRVEADVALYMERHGIKKFFVVDENPCGSKAFVKELMQRLNRLGAEYTFMNMELDKMDREVLDLYFAQREVNFFSIGVESGNDRVLKEILRRKLDRETFRRRLGLLREMMGPKGFITGSFMLGMPGETREEIMDTITYAGEIEIDWAAFYCYMPLPGTPLCQVALDQGLVDPGTLDYSRINPNESVVDQPHLAASEITFLRNYANYRVNFVANRGIATDPDKTRRAQEYVLSVAGEHAFAHWALARCHQNLGDTAQAARHQARFEALKDKDPWRPYVERLQEEGLLEPQGA